MGQGDIYPHEGKHRLLHDCWEDRMTTTHESGKWWLGFIQQWRVESLQAPPYSLHQVHSGFLIWYCCLLSRLFRDAWRSPKCYCGLWVIFGRGMQDLVALACLVGRITQFHPFVHLTDEKALYTSTEQQIYIGFIRDYNIENIEAW